MAEKDADTPTAEEGMPEMLNVEAPGDTSPEASPVSTEDVVTEPAPKVEGTEQPSPQDTGEEIQLTDVEKKFIEAGLDRRFDSVDDMVNRMSETDRYIAGLEAERNAYRDQLKKPEAEETAPSSEDFLEDPVGTMNKILAGHERQVTERLDKIETSTFINSKGDYGKMQPEMEKQLALMPELAMLPKSVAIRALYSMAKAASIPSIVSDATSKVTTPPANKARAETGGQTSPRARGEKSLGDYVKMSDKELEAEFGITGE